MGAETARKEYRQWPVELLRGLLRRYSPSGKEQHAVEFLAATMEEAGWETSIDEAGNFVGERGPKFGPRRIVFLGHVDTVAGEIPLRESEGLLHGRGAVDAKGPLAAFLAAATRAQLPTDLRVTCVGAVEEEAASSKGARHVLDKYRPDFLIVGEPSGWDTLCVGYRGNCHVQLRVEQDKTHGASGVASAATQACRFWQAALAAAETQKQGDKVTEQASVDVAAFNTESDGLKESATIRLDIRTPPNHDAAALRAALDAAVPPTGKLEIVENLPPFRGSKAGPLVREFLKAIRAAGGKPRFSFKAGTSDMNIVAPAWKCPSVAYGPGDSSLDHTPNEHISLDEFLRSLEVLRRVLEGLK